jgi:antitoxin component HigA of HigAB toxin-antitoxin module
LNLSQLQSLDAAGSSASILSPDVLVTLVCEYEGKQFRWTLPIMAIQFRIEQHRLTRKDLEPMIGSRARVSEVMTGSVR